MKIIWSIFACRILYECLATYKLNGKYFILWISLLYPTNNAVFCRKRSWIIFVSPSRYVLNCWQGKPYVKSTALTQGKIKYWVKGSQPWAYWRVTIRGSFRTQTSKMNILKNVSTVVSKKLHLRCLKTSEYASDTEA